VEGGLHYSTFKDPLLTSYSSKVGSRAVGICCVNQYPIKAMNSQADVTSSSIVRRSVYIELESTVRSCRAGPQVMNYTSLGVTSSILGPAHSVSASGPLQYSYTHSIYTSPALVMILTQVERTSHALHCHSIHCVCQYASQRNGWCQITAPADTFCVTSPIDAKRVAKQTFSLQHRQAF